MSINITMPALSPTMEEGKLAKWHVKEGDAVVKGQPRKGLVQVAHGSAGEVPHGIADPVEDALAVPPVEDLPLERRVIGNAR